MRDIIGICVINCIETDHIEVSDVFKPLAGEVSDVFKPLAGPNKSMEEPVAHISKPLCFTVQRSVELVDTISFSNHHKLNFIILCVQVDLTLCDDDDNNLLNTVS